MTCSPVFFQHPTLTALTFACLSPLKGMAARSQGGKQRGTFQSHVNPGDWSLTTTKVKAQLYYPDPKMLANITSIRSAIERRHCAPTQTRPASDFPVSGKPYSNNSCQHQWAFFQLRQVTIWVCHAQGWWDEIISTGQFTGAERYFSVPSSLFPLTTPLPFGHLLSAKIWKENT